MDSVESRRPMDSDESRREGGGLISLSRTTRVLVIILAASILVLVCELPFPPERLTVQSASSGGGDGAKRTSTEASRVVKSAGEG